MPLDWVKDLVSWLACSLGFTDVANWLDSFSFADMIKEGVGNVFDWLTEWTICIWDTIKNWFMKVWSWGTGRSADDFNLGKRTYGFFDNPYENLITQGGESVDVVFDHKHSTTKIKSWFK